ncbi:hypothetical protein [Coleofasciculus chthonoplastes]|uniref:hypothetical protein n=1 Tax=Coleofasciculus TaxID=669368 RepID=UPI0032F1D6D4
MPRYQTLGVAFALSVSLTAPDRDPERLCKNLLCLGAKSLMQSFPPQVRSRS